MLEEALNPQTTPERLQELSKTNDSQIISAIARNPNAELATLFTVWNKDPQGFDENPAATLHMLEKPQFWNIMPHPTLISLLRLPSMPESVLRFATTHAYAYVRTGAAMAPHLPLDCLEHLARDHTNNTRENVARHAKATPLILQLLLGDTESTVRQLALLHPNTPTELIELVKKLGRTVANQALPVDLTLTKEDFEPWLACGPWIRAQIARHPSTTPEQLERMYQDPRSTELIESLAANIKTPPPLLEKIVKTSTYLPIAQAIAKNPSAPQAALKELAARREASTGVLIAKRLDLGEEVFSLLVSHAFDDTRIMAAQNPSILPKFLEVLAKEKNWKIRAEAAKRTELSLPSLAMLARDKNEAVRLVVAQNEATPPPVLDELCQDASHKVRAAAQNNPSAPKGTVVLIEEALRSPEIETSVLWRLASGGPYAKKIVADHPNTPPEIIAQLANSPHQQDRTIIAQSHKTPRGLLQRLSTDPEAEVRIAVAKNPVTPPHVLAELIKDDIEGVLQSLAENPSSPLPVLEKLVELQKPYKTTECRGLKERLAKNPATPPHLLKQLAQSKEPSTLSELAQNPTAPFAVLAALGKSYGPRLLKNPKIMSLYRQGQSSLQELPADCLFSLLQQKNISHDFLQWASLHSSDEIKCSVAAHPKTSAELLEKLFEGASLFLLRAIAKNPNTPQHLLVALAQSPDDSIKKRLLSHPRSPLFVIAHIANRAKPFMQTLAQQALQRAHNKGA